MNRSQRLAVAVTNLYMTRMTGRRMAKTVKERARKPKSVNAAQGLIDALKFVNAAQKKNDHIFQKYVVLQDKTLIATDGTLAIGTRIEEEINSKTNSFVSFQAILLPTYLVYRFHKSEHDAVRR